MTIDTLPDDALLEIFTHYLLEDWVSYIDDTETWHTLVHVCRRWRNIVFESPRRLNLRIRCTARTPVTAMSNVWPTLPIVITDDYSNVHSGSSFMEGGDNIVAALELKDRVHGISLWNYPPRHLKRFAEAMLGSFPALTCLEITSTDEMVPVTVFSEAFLGGSAPRLRSCYLEGIPFPGIQKLLLSTSHLVDLALTDIPHSGYISPEAMVTCLSAMPTLKWFSLGFVSRKSVPDRSSQRPPPPTPAVLPTLTMFDFGGASEYIKDLLYRIEAPLLYVVTIHIYYPRIHDAPQPHNFLARTKIFESCSAAVVEFTDHDTCFRYGYQFSLGISNVMLWNRPSSLVHISSLSFPLICTLESLDIRVDGITGPPYQDNPVAENTEWLEFLSPFTALKYLRLDKNSARRIAPALRHSQLAAEGATQVLPALQSIFIEGLSGPIQEAIGDFVTARSLSGLPVAVYSWDGQSGTERTGGRRALEV